MLAGSTGRDFDVVLRRYRVMYTDCAARHNQLTQEIRQREQIK